MLTLTDTPAAITQCRLQAAQRRALKQLAASLQQFAGHFPDDTSSGQHYALRRNPPHATGANSGWTTGFWTGLAWLAYELSGNASFRRHAEAHLPSYQRRLAQDIELDHHDLGFLYGPSCVTAYQLTGSAAALRQALAAADRLLARFLPGAGVIQAWGALDDPAEQGRIIIDTAMNLPLLHWASRVTGQSRYTLAAKSHLQRARGLLLRADGSSIHSYHLDPASGAPRRASTVQGRADESCWARGQAWGVYGYALNHRHAPELGLLDTARHMADYWLAHLPANGVAPWDLSLGADAPRDSSASAIAACGLLELAGQLPPGEQRLHYADAALHMLHGLVQHCATDDHDSNALLLHGVYSMPHGHGIDEANLWGDYYFLEALARVNSGWRSFWHAG